MFPQVEDGVSTRNLNKKTVKETVGNNLVKASTS